MTTYIYEILTQKPGEEPRFVEIKQSMKDAALTKHPETGEPMKRVMFGGYGALSKKADSARASSGSGSGSGSCGPSCGCH